MAQYAAGSGSGCSVNLLRALLTRAGIADAASGPIAQIARTAAAA